MAERTCSVDGCDRRHSARGFCNLHYQRLLSGSDMEAPPTPRFESTEDRFWAKVDRTETCWLWTASTLRTGYGEFWSGERMVLAHRFSYRLLVGEIPEGLELDHLCRVRRCVNPAHLEPVTHDENQRRSPLPPVWMANRSKTHCIHGHAFTPENTYRDPKRGWRQCRACIAERREAKRVHARD